MSDYNQWNNGMNGEQQQRPNNGQWSGPSPEQQGYERQQYQRPEYQYDGGYYNEDQLNQYYRRNNAFDSCPEGKSRGIAGLLAIFLGGLGVQYFYLGKIGAGLICILLSLVTCGVWEIVTLIQGILLLCMNNYEFRQKFVLSNSFMPMF